MPANRHATPFFIDAYTLLRWAFGLVVLASMNASAAYTDCTTNAGAGLSSDCFSLQLQPQAAMLSTSPYDATLVATTSMATVLSPPAHALAAPVNSNTGFYVNQPRSRDGNVPEPLPLALLAIGLVAVFLIRAKSVNNK